MSVSLTGSSEEAVRQLAERHGVPEGQIVRYAIRLLQMFSDETEAGSVFRIQPAGGESERLRLVIG